MINLINEGGKLYASYRERPASDLHHLKQLTRIQYLGFTQTPNVLDYDTTIINRSTDFPGWTKIEWALYDDRKSALERHPSILFEADLSPSRRFLADNFCKIDKPRRAYLDIETDSRVPPRVQIDTNQGRILCWCTVDDAGVKQQGLLQEDTDEDEARLLEELWSLLAKYDQVVAWFGHGFDFPRIKDRGKLLGVQSCHEHHRRLLFLDQLEVYKRLNVAAESGAEKTSHKLEAIAQRWLGTGKDSFDSSKTWDAWAAGGEQRASLVKYCARDVELLPLIEKESGFLELFQTICELCCILPDTYSLYPTAMVDGMLLRKAHLQKTHLPSKIEREPEEDYEGAFVFEPTVTGIARTVHVCDFAALYPSIIRTWNMGIESKNGMGCVAPGTNVSFDTEKETMLAAIVGEAMAARKIWKDKKNSLTPGTEEWKVAERMSTAWKVFTNIIYGVAGSRYSRHYDRDVARSITLTGQWLIKQVAAAAEARGWKVVAGDTDSLMVTGCSVDEFREFVKWCNETLFPKLLDEHDCKPEFRCIKLAYEKAFDRFVVPQGNAGYPSKKRYFGSWLHAEGVPARPVPKSIESFDADLHSKPEIKGIEFKRGDTIAYARKLQEECIYKILGGEENEDVFEKWVLDARTRVLDGALELDDIVLTKGIQKDLADYKAHPAQVTIARELADRGEDIHIGSKVSYVIIDGRKSPIKVIPASDYNGVADYRYYWNKLIYPGLRRILAGAFSARDWKRWKAPRCKDRVLVGQTGLFDNPQIRC